MTVLQAVLLGIAQGLTEFLPISSSGHLSLLQQWFGLSGDLLLFDVSVHFATFIAIVIFFRRDIIRLRAHDLMVLAVGTLPAVLVGLSLKQHFEALTESTIFVGSALLVTAAINFFSDAALEKKREQSSQTIDFLPRHLSIWKAIAIGSAQAVAILPGISRSGSTVAGGAAVGLSREQAFRFSFLIGLPAILGATLLTVKDVLDQGMGDVSVTVLVIGALAAGVTGFASLKLFALIIKRGRLEVFGWYCLCIGVVALLSTQM